MPPRGKKSPGKKRGPKGKKGKKSPAKKIAKGAKGAKGKKGYKDPDKPKRALSAYNLMAREKREDIKKTLPADAKATEIMKAIAVQWQQMTDEEKKPYQEKADEQKIQQQAAMEAWKATAAKRGKQRRGKVKDPTKPKRPKSAYLFFTEEHRDQVKEELGSEAKATEIMARLGELWRQTEQSDRTHYEQKAHDAKEKYNQAILSWSNLQTL